MRHLLTGLFGLILTVSAAAQQPAANPSAAAPEVPAAKPVITMQEPLVGDHWTYEIRDLITGQISETATVVITDVTPAEVSVRSSIQGSVQRADRDVIAVYDRSWNLKSSGVWKHSPNDGLGIKSSLQVGATWTFRSDDIGTSERGTSHFKRTGNSKTVGQEKITTKAGTFDTFKIETTYSTQRTDDPGTKNETTIQTWYAPAINRWVKRVRTSRTNKLLRTNTSNELVDYGRKGQP